jgi:hypothetical protein
MSGLVIGVALDRALGRFAQAKLEDALVDAAQLLDREVAVVAVFRAADVIVFRKMADTASITD